MNVYFFDAVIDIPFGAHPSSSYPFYAQDMDHYFEYVDAAVNPEKFSEYLDKYVYGPETHEEYLERIGGLKKITKLTKINRFIIFSSVIFLTIHLCARRTRKTHI